MGLKDCGQQADKIENENRKIEKQKNKINSTYMGLEDRGQQGDEIGVHLLAHNQPLVVSVTRGREHFIIN